MTVSNGTLPGALRAGTHAARPAATAVSAGTIYSCSTHSLVYQSDGATWSTWASIGVVGLVLLEQHAASSSATLDFTTCISATYDEYIIEFVGIVPATDAVSLGCRVSTDGGSTWDSTSGNYYNGNLYAGSGTWTYVGANSAGGVQMAHNISNTTISVNGHVRFYPTGSGQRMFVGETAYVPSGANRTINLVNSDYESGTFNALRFLMSSGNIASGTIRVYGVAK